MCVCLQCLLLHLPSSPKEGKTWKDAESICSSFESSLVTIDSEIEQGQKNQINCHQINSKWHLQATSVCFSCYDFCSLYYHVAAGECSRCLDQSEMDWLSQLVSSRERSHCKVSLSIELMSYSTCIVLLTHIWLQFRLNNCF